MYEPLLNKHLIVCISIGSACIAVARCCLATLGPRLELGRCAILMLASTVDRCPLSDYLIGISLMDSRISITMKHNCWHNLWRGCIGTALGDSAGCTALHRAKR